MLTSYDSLPLLHHLPLDHRHWDHTLLSYNTNLLLSITRDYLHSPDHVTLIVDIYTHEMKLLLHYQTTATFFDFSPHGLYFYTSPHQHTYIPLTTSVPQTLNWSTPRYAIGPYTISYPTATTSQPMTYQISISQEVILYGQEELGRQILTNALFNKYAYDTQGIYIITQHTLYHWTSANKLLLMATIDGQVLDFCIYQGAYYILTTTEQKQTLYYNSLGKTALSVSTEATKLLKNGWLVSMMIDEQILEIQTSKYPENIIQKYTLINLNKWGKVQIYAVKEREIVVCDRYIIYKYVATNDKQQVVAIV